MSIKIRYFFLIFLLYFSNSFALSPELKLEDQAQEQRAMALFLEVKCAICKGQSIADSDTEFSYQMRKLIREKILLGESDSQIQQDLVQQFGKDILFSNEKFSLAMFFVIVIFAAILFWVIFKNMQS